MIVRLVLKVETMRDDGSEKPEAKVLEELKDYLDGEIIDVDAGFDANEESVGYLMTVKEIEKLPDY